MALKIGSFKDKNVRITCPPSAALQALAGGRMVPARNALACEAGGRIYESICMENIKNLLKPLDIKKAPAYKWQELALEITVALTDGNNKKSSIFKCCKENTHFAKIAFEDCKELNKLYAHYFLKVYNSLKRPKEKTE